MENNPQNRAATSVEDTPFLITQAPRSDDGDRREAAQRSYYRDFNKNIQTVAENIGGMKMKTSSASSSSSHGSCPSPVAQHVAGTTSISRIRRGRTGGQVLKRQYTIAPFNDHDYWRKRGQKNIVGNNFQRSYYDCGYTGCPAKMRVQPLKLDTQPLYLVINDGVHTCNSKSSASRSSGGGGHQLIMKIDHTPKGSIMLQFDPKASIMNQDQHFRQNIYTTTQSSDGATSNLQDNIIWKNLNLIGPLPTLNRVTPTCIGGTVGPSISSLENELMSDNFDEPMDYEISKGHSSASSMSTNQSEGFWNNMLSIAQTGDKQIGCFLQNNDSFGSAGTQAGIYAVGTLPLEDNTSIKNGQVIEEGFEAFDELEHFISEEPSSFHSESNASMIMDYDLQSWVTPTIAEAGDEEGDKVSTTLDSEDAHISTIGTVTGQKEDTVSSVQYDEEGFTEAELMELLSCQYSTDHPCFTGFESNAFDDELQDEQYFYQSMPTIHMRSW